MRKKYSLLYKVLSFISGTSLVLQSFVPLFSYGLITKPVYAEEDTAVTEEVVTETQDQTVQQPADDTQAPPAEAAPTISETSVEIPTTVEEVTTNSTLEELAPTPIEVAQPSETGPPASDEQGEIGADGASTEIVTNETDTTAEASANLATSVKKVYTAEGQSFNDSTNEYWNIDLENGISETKGKVELGIKYLFPQENKVTVTFTALPKDENLRTSLKIQKVKISDLRLPEDVKPYGEYAYDITTGMENGTFEYDITLPKPEDASAEVNYMEDPKGELKTVDEGKTSQEGNVAKVENMDHFSIWFVSATLGITGLINGQTHVTVSPGESVIAELTVGTNGSGSNDDWRSSSYKIGSGGWNCINTPDFTNDGDHSATFDFSAPVSVGTYNISFRAYNGSDCSGSFDTETLNNAITVASGYTPTRICHATGSESNPYVSQTPSTLGRLMGHVGIGHQDGEDIIPPIAVYLPAGQNWTTAGEAIWNNDCSPFGKINGHKYEDTDGNYHTDADQIPVQGWNMSLYSCVGSWTPATCTTLEQTAVTDANGYFEFTNLTGTMYRVIEESRAGWNILYPSMGIWDTNMQPMATSTMNFVNQKSQGTLTIIKDTQPEDTQNFIFTVSNPTGVVETAELDDDGTHGSSRPNNETFTLPVSTYTVTENIVSGWMLSSASCTGPNQWGFGNGVLTVDVGAGTDMVCTFTNVKPGSISGYKWNDANGNGVRDGRWIRHCHWIFCDWDWEFTEERLSGWTITLDKDANGSIEDTTETDSNGNYSFNNLIPGTYKVCEVMQSGWTNTSPGNLCYTITIPSREGCHESEYNLTDKNFGNRQTPYGSITIRKLVDMDGDGQYESGDSVANDLGFRWGIDDPAPNRMMGTTADLLAFGSYTVTENSVPGYEYVGWYSTNSEGRSCSNANTQYPVGVTLEPNTTSTDITFCNRISDGDITVTKFNDLDGDQVHDTDEPTLSGWEITLGEEPNQVTNADGIATFSNLPAGVYPLDEVLPADSGWRQTIISCDDQRIESQAPTLTSILAGIFRIPQVYAELEQHGYPVTVNPGQTTHCWIGNQRTTPVITITKINDTAGGDRSPGDTVKFTLTITVTQAPANNVQVTDLTAGGFVYVAGSWLANSTVRGDLRTLALMMEPVYASPGVWNLGNMAANEVVTLTYDAKIDGGQQSGLYKDLASANGTSLIGDLIYANPENPGYINDTYVGTEVNVVRNDPGSIAFNVIKTGSVLGASTELPATGASIQWIILAGLLFIGGAGAVGTGIVLNQKSMKRSKRRLHV